MKRIISLVLISVLIYTSHNLTFADDLKESTALKYDEAFKFITDAYDYSSYSLHLFGYICDPVASENSVNRETFCLGLTHLLNIRKSPEERNNSFDKVFKDVDESDFFINSIISDIYNYDKEIIKGYPDGTFRREEEMRFEEAVTMMVRALGYEKEMESKVYPMDYIEKASEVGILDNIDSEIGKPLSYGVASQIFLNSLTVEIKSGKSDDEDSETLLQRHNISIYKDMTFASLHEDSGIVKFKDDKGNIEIFKYHDGFTFENLKEKKVSLWVDLGVNSRDLLIKEIGAAEMDDCIIRIIDDTTNSESDPH